MLLFNCFVFVKQWLAQSTHCKKVLGSSPVWSFLCGLCMGSSRSSPEDKHGVRLTGDGLNLNMNGCLSLCDRLVTCPGCSPREQSRINNQVSVPTSFLIQSTDTWYFEFHFNYLRKSNLPAGLTLVMTSPQTQQLHAFTIRKRLTYMRAAPGKKPLLSKHNIRAKLQFTIEWKGSDRVIVNMLCAHQRHL